MKLLIADDEMQIRTGLAQGIEWREYGISQVLVAENGIQAFEICEKERPEIILTDIRMPGLTGLELGKKVTELYNTVEVIILSGYSDFEYAREAIKFGVFDYLLKPINIESLTERIAKARATILEKKEQTENMEIAQNLQRKENLESLINCNENLTETQCCEMLDYVEMNRQHTFIAGICHSDSMEAEKKEQIGVYTEKLVEEKIEQMRGIVLFRHEDELFFLLEVFSNNEKARKIKKLEEEIAIINRILRSEMQTTLTTALSSEGEFKSLPHLFRECKNSLKHRLYRGTGQLIQFAELEEEIELRVSPVRGDEIKKFIEKFDYESMKIYIKETFQELEQQKITSIDLVKSVCLELKNLLLSILEEKGVDIKSVLDKNTIILNEIPNYLILEDYEEWIDSIYYLILNGLAHLSGKQHSRAIVLAVDYISRNFASDLNLEMTATYVNKSKNYFSYLFKKETGTSFIEFLNEIRIKEAQKLLDVTDLLTYEISDQVGYNDYKYFSSVFKKITGTSPAKYRKRNRK